MFTVRQVMQTHVVTVQPSDSVKHAHKSLVEHDISGMPVVTEDGRLVGVFSEVDQLQADFPGTVGQCMTTDPISIDVDTTIAEAAGMFRTVAVHRLPVTDEGRLVGIIGCRDIFRFYQDLQEEIGALGPLVQETPEYAQVWCNED